MGRGGHATGDGSTEQQRPARLAEDARFADFLGPSFVAADFVSEALSSVGGNVQVKSCQRIACWCMNAQGESSCLAFHVLGCC